jgi:hypothetical protein
MAWFGTLSLACLLSAVTCLAQDESNFHSCTLNIGGGFAPVAGAESGNLSAGWDFQAGGGFAINHRFFVTADFMFDQLGVKQTALEAAGASNPTNVGVLEATGGRAKYFSTTLDPTYRFPSRGPATVYLFGGFGWMRRSIELTGVSGEGSLLEPNGPVVFGSGGDSGAYDAGAGANFRLGNKTGGLMLYVEARVIHGLAVNKSSTLIPISGGIRW